MSETGDSIASEIRKISESLSPRTLHQYKTFNTQYIQWCGKIDLLQNQNDNSIVSYKNLPISSILIHWFLLDTVITKTTNVNKILTILQSYINSFQFLQKICKIHGNQIVNIDWDYLDSLLNIHKYWKQISETLTFPSNFVISFNIWNPETTHLKSTHFKTSLEKFRFLVDFQFTTHLKLNYSERSKIKLHCLKINDMNKFTISLLSNNNTNNNLTKPMHLLPQNSPFTCPFNSLATYLFFRFYGIPNISKGDGFPNLFNETTSQSLALIKGRLATEYPKDTTLNFAYTSIFKYCNLPYKRRQYFENLWGKDSIKTNFMQYNDATIDLLNNFNDFYPDAKRKPTDSAFVDNVPFDFTTILNFKNPYQDYTSFSINDFFNKRGQLKPPDSILLQFFPEVEFYKLKKNYEKLSSEAKDILKLIELIRLIFVSNLPIIFKIFPKHDIFKHELFENTDIQSFLNDAIFQTNSKTNTILPFKNFETLSNEDLYKQLIETPLSMANQSTISAQSNYNKDIINDDMLDEFRKQNFQFVQFQTLSNFKTLITFLTKIFNNLSIKKSSKEAIAKQLNLLNDSILERINNSTPKDIKDYFLKKELMKHKQSQLTQYDKNEDSDSDEAANETSEILPQPRLMALDDTDQSDSDDAMQFSTDQSDVTSDEENVNESMQEELKIMVDRFVSSKVDSIISQHLEAFENRLDYMVESLVDEKIEAKLQKLDFSKYLMKRKRSELDFDNSSDELEDNYSRKLSRNEPNPYRKIIEDSKFTIRSVDSLSSPFSTKESAGYSTPKVTANQKEIDSMSHNESVKSKAEVFGDTSRDDNFKIDENIDNIEGVILEWFTPNPKMGNQCVHSMNKTHDKSWRAGFESLYKQRKQMVEFYVYLINSAKYDRYVAIEICNNLKEKHNCTMKEFSRFLKSWKKDHDGSFTGIIES